MMSRGLPRLTGYENHAVEAAGRRASGCVQIGVSIKPKQIYVLVVAARTGEQGDDLRAIAAKDENESARFQAKFGAGLQLVERGDDFRDVAGALVFVVIGKEARRAITEVGDFVADGLQTLDDAGGANGGGCFFASRKESGCAGGCSDDGNFVRLTNDLNRQGTLLVLRRIA